KVGEYVLEEPIANFPDPNSYMDSLKIGKTARHGTIGGEILSRFNIVFNFSKEEIFVKKNSSFKKRFYYNLSGLIVKAIGSNLNTFEIQEVRDLSTAHRADIREGDLILSINGIAANTLDLNQVLGLLSTKPGKKINLQINREGQILRKTFRLEDAILSSAGELTLTYIVCLVEKQLRTPRLDGILNRVENRFGGNVLLQHIIEDTGRTVAFFVVRILEHGYRDVLRLFVRGK